MMENNTLKQTNHLSWQETLDLRRSESAKYLSELRPLFMKEGFKCIVIHYDGGGDSGESYAAEGFKHTRHDTDNNSNQEHFEERTWDDGGKVRQIPIDEWKCTRYQNVIKKIEVEFRTNNVTELDTPELSYALTELIDYDWYNNEGGGGRVIWELEDNRVIVDGYQTFYDTTQVDEKYSLDEIV